MRYNRRFNRRRFHPHRRKTGGGFRSILLTLLLFSILGAAIVYLPVNRQPRESLTGPVYVIDGDTVVLGKIHIRLKGIDAPEMQQSCQKPDGRYACGQDARNALRVLIGKRQIRCEKEGVDQYARDLARCYLGDTDLNGWMVEQGWAVAYGDYRGEEAEARRNRRGIWAGRFETPSQWRKEHTKPGEAPEADRNPSPPDVIGNVLTYIRDYIAAILDFFQTRS
ncbi:thermonuclease family protein [Ochrobactrum sp. CM-21-5]|nr:thermonuclease family protein [Ochrobactrum sp. CM-21-5]MBC2885001.1 thermonuclease family protein [Ochrobactrum sp. CM-21-5]